MTPCPDCRRPLYAGRYWRICFHCDRTFSKILELHPRRRQAPTLPSPGVLAARLRAWRAAHPEATRAHRRRYRDTHRNDPHYRERQAHFRRQNKRRRRAAAAAASSHGRPTDVSR